MSSLHRDTEEGSERNSPTTPTDREVRWNRGRGKDSARAVTSWWPCWPREVKLRGSQGSCGCGGYFRPWGLLIWLPGKPPSIADGESHREGSCPAMTDGETNSLWNSISCETHSEGGAASTIIQSCQHYSMGQTRATAKGLQLAKRTWYYW